MQVPNHDGITLIETKINFDKTLTKTNKAADNGRKGGVVGTTYNRLFFVKMAVPGLF